jgi:hypothetical protein
VLFNHSNYSSQSSSVADWGLPYGGARVFGGGNGFYRTNYPTGYGHPASSYGRPSVEAYNRVPAPIVRSPQSVRPAYGEGFYGRSGETHAPAYGRAESPASDRMQQAYRSPVTYPKAEKTGGFHLFGGGGESKLKEPKFKEPKFKEPKFSAPKFKEPKMSSGHFGGGGHSSGHGGGKHHG